MIFNPFRPRDSYSLSDFDVRNQINSNFFVELPFGKDKLLGRNMPGWANQIFGGWQITGLVRWRQGFPISVNNGYAFPTNYYIPTPATLKPGSPKPEITVDKSNPNGPNAFGNPAAAYDSFKYTSSGSSGSRNVLTGPGFFTIDGGLHKAFRVAEGQRVVFRWETFNVTNSTNFGSISAIMDYKNTFGNYTSTTGSARVMQFALRYEF